MITLNGHAASRAAQRNLSYGDIEYILLHGRRFHRAGALICFLGRKDIPARDARDSRLTRLAGSAVVIEPRGGCVITVWRNAQTGSRHIHRKPERGFASGLRLLTQLLPGGDF